MKILLAASELDPFAEGPMGTAVARVVMGLRGLGHEVVAVLPLTRAARESSKPKRSKTKFQIQVGPGRYPCEVWEGATPAGAPVYFVRRDEFFDRTGLYGNESGDYGDNAARFIFFSKAAVELARKLEPDAIGAHGWQAALTAVFAKESGLPAPVALTPHGLDFQGNFWSYDFGLTNLPDHYFSARGLEFYGSTNFLKAGIVFADAVVLPGERFAAAAQTAAAGCGLENVLREHAAKIWGIADGAAVEGWDPSADNALAAPCDAKRPAARRAGLAASLDALGLQPGRALAVVFAEASPGAGLLFDTLDRLLATGVRIALFGPAPEACRMAIEVARRKHAGRFAALAAPGEALVRRCLAAADFLILPGAAAPASPWLARAQRYGVAPIAFRCDGLPITQWPSGNGFLFDRASPDALADALRAALEAGDPDALAHANMAIDQTPAAAASAYSELFEALKKR